MVLERNDLEVDMGGHTAEQGAPQVRLRLLSSLEGWRLDGEDAFGWLHREVEHACASVGPTLDRRRARIQAAVECVIRLLAADRGLAELVLLDPSAAGPLGSARRQLMVDRAVDALCGSRPSRYGTDRLRAEIAVGGALHAAAERLLADGPIDERKLSDAIGQWLDTALPAAHQPLRLV